MRRCPMTRSVRSSISSAIAIACPRSTSASATRPRSPFTDASADPARICSFGRPASTASCNASSIRSSARSGRPLPVIDQRKRHQGFARRGSTGPRPGLRLRSSRAARAPSRPAPELAGRPPAEGVARARLRSSRRRARARVRRSGRPRGCPRDARLLAPPASAPRRRARSAAARRSARPRARGGTPARGGRRRSRRAPPLPGSIITQSAKRT